MSILFDRTKIKSITLRNRFIRSATYTRSATDDGYVTDNRKILLTLFCGGGTASYITIFIIV